jgi:NAD(P) transhydrogenase subunit alpha
MKIGVLRETAQGERRVALVPDAIVKLIAAGHSVVVERNAGTSAGFLDAAYEKAGATLAADAAGIAAAKPDVVVKVRKPSVAEAKALPQGVALVALLTPGANEDLLPALSAAKVSALALELVPRITRAQSMDVLSSQSGVAGYKAVLVGASALDKFLPMLTTAAGSIAPAKAFILGAGVAGLQAIATARRLGAVVSGFDVRSAAGEQVRSLGAQFVEPAAKADGAGGYARAQTDDEAAQNAAIIAKHIASQDLVITTALIPGRKAPILITDAMLATMRPGSVVVDLAAESGGNVEGVVSNETVDRHGVHLIGASSLPSSVPFHASQMFAVNVRTLLQHLTGEGGALKIDRADEITGPMLLLDKGEPVTPPAKK